LKTRTALFTAFRIVADRGEVAEVDLAVNLFSRRVVGWATSANIDRHLALAALDMALVKRRPQAGVSPSFGSRLLGVRALPALACGYDQEGTFRLLENPEVEPEEIGRAAYRAAGTLVVSVRRLQHRRSHLTSPVGSIDLCFWGVTRR
jgi:hypothetical protein